MEALSTIDTGIGFNNVVSSQSGTFEDNPFLTLLIAQLRNQTPLEPVDNASFMQQVATFSSMEEQRNLNTNMLKLLDLQTLLARLQGLSEGSALLGKEVTYAVDGNRTGKGEVNSVYINEEGEVRMRIGDDDISMSQIVAIGQLKSDDA
jgi:flagellar basal-body rod modification protein FlgD